MRALFVEAGHRCACCGEAFALERAHIVPWRKSRDHSAANLLCLCANCHALADQAWDRKTFYEYKHRPWVLRRFEDARASPNSTRATPAGVHSDGFLHPRPLNSPKEAALVCFSHLTVEQERWGLDETDANSLRSLREMQSVTWKTISGDEVTRDVTASEKDDWLGDYRARMQRYLSAGVGRVALGERMDRIRSHVALFGYNQHYAGFEAFLRERFYQLLRFDEWVQPPLGMPGWIKRFEDVPDALWTNTRIQTEAAVYMAYTDYAEFVIRRGWTLDSAPDPRVQPTDSAGG